jgi:hypothetical protein
MKYLNKLKYFMPILLLIDILKTICCQSLNRIFLFLKFSFNLQSFFSSTESIFATEIY